MEISNNKKKLTATKSELESKINSKKDLHSILRQDWKKLIILCIGQLYIPNMNQCSFASLKCVLCELNKKGNSCRVRRCLVPLNNLHFPKFMMGTRLTVIFNFQNVPKFLNFFAKRATGWYFDDYGIVFK